MRDPFQRYTHDDISRMSEEEFGNLVDEHNAYVQEKYDKLKDKLGLFPDFDSIEKLLAYYNCRPFNEALQRINDRLG